MNRFKCRQIIAGVALFAMVAGILGVQAPAEAWQTEAKGKVNIIINSKVVTVLPGDQSPVIIGDRTYVPIRVISENLGAKVDWNQEGQQVIINWKSNAASSIAPDSQGQVQIIIDGKLLSIPVAYGKPFITPTTFRTMIPLRIVGEALGCEVSWVDETKTVIINAPLSADNQLLQDLAKYRTNLKLINGSVINSEVLVNMDASAYSSEQLAVFKTYLNQLAKYQPTVMLPNGELINAADLTITGNSYLTADQLKKWIVNEIPRISAGMTVAGLQFKPIPELAELYIKIGEQYGIRGDIAFCQAAKETGFWQFKGDVQPWQNNYCGLWAIGSPLTGQESCNGADPNLVRFEAGVHGAIFVSPAAGVEAHIQHLYAYANKNTLPSGKVLISPRYSLVNRGIGPTWLQLNARWAVPGTTYGQSIISDYWSKAVNNS